MDKQEMTGKDLLLCFLYSPGINDDINEPILGRTKLTKMMYLFEKQLYKDFFKDYIQISLPEFQPYLFGPFSKQLFGDLSFFVSIGLIETNETDIPLSSADLIEGDEAYDTEYDPEDVWREAQFDDSKGNYELSYFLSQNGVQYVTDKLWHKFTEIQKEKLKLFKKQINLISLDELLNYVYNKYPDDAENSIIADKYIKRS